MALKRLAVEMDADLLKTAHAIARLLDTNLSAVVRERLEAWVAQRRDKLPVLKDQR